MSVGRRALRVLFLGILPSLLVYGFAWKRGIDFRPQEGDAFYHVALSKLLPWHGVLKSLPQVEDLGWGAFFPEKEYLFHWVTRTLHAFGGEKAIFLTAPFFFLGTALVLFGGGLWNAAPAGLLGGVLFSALWSAFLWRTIILRPHVGAIFAFSGVLVGIMRGWWRVAVFFGLLFPLLYHGIQMPFFAIAAGLLVFSRTDSAAQRKAAVRAGLGLGVGLLLNPYFPANLLMGVEHMRIALMTAGLLPGQSDLVSGIPFGRELYPVATPLYFWGIAPLGLIVGYALLRDPEWLREIGERLGSLLRLRRSVAAPWKADPILTWLLFVLAPMALVQGFAPRMIEYLAPTSVLFVGLFLSRAELGARRPWFLLTLAATVMTRSTLPLFQGLAPPPLSLDANQPLVEALRRIPPGPAKIFQCEWDGSPFLFYFRPDLRFIDILDPSFLLSQSEALYRARRSLITGAEVDVYPLVAGAFGADYTFCRNSAVNSRLLADPRFERIYPRMDEGAAGTLPWIFARRRNFRDPFVHAFSYSSLTADESKNRMNLRPRDLARKKWEKVEVKRASYEGRDYTASYFELPSSQDSSCTWLKIDEKRRIQNSYLLLGGGPAFRVWIGDRPWFRSGAEVVSPRITAFALPIEKLELSQLRILVCERESVPFRSISVGILSRQEMAALCPERKVTPLGDQRWERSPRQTAELRRECFAEIVDGERPSH